MKSLANPEDRTAILNRLQNVRPDSPRHWGTMNSHQMVCHLCDAFRGVTGEKPLAPMKGWVLRPVVRFLALYVTVPWPKNIKTMPEMDQQLAGTPPVEFERDRKELERLFAKFTRQPRDFAWTPHPIFLNMPDRDWMRWAYLHMDHHFRQFGV